VSRIFRRALVLSFVAAAVTAQQIPRPAGYVNDFANVISAGEEQQLDRIITAVREQTNAEIAVVTVDTIAPYATIEDYGIALADEWKVGSASDDNGVILILSMSERQVRIEVGYGLEGALPDGKAGGILDDYVLPQFRDGNFGAGMINGVSAVAQVIADEYGVTLQAPVTVSRVDRAEPSFDIGRLVYLIFVLIAFGGRFFLWPLLFAGRRRGFFGGGFGTGSGFRSGGSSFGGFGGGGFGGGGASRGF
jgi:uncharacterized protein